MLKTTIAKPCQHTQSIEKWGSFGQENPFDPSKLPFLSAAAVYSKRDADDPCLRPRFLISSDPLYMQKLKY